MGQLQRVIRTGRTGHWLKYVYYHPLLPINLTAAR